MKKYFILTSCWVFVAASVFAQTTGPTPTTPRAGAVNGLTPNAVSGFTPNPVRGFSSAPVSGFSSRPIQGFSSAPVSGMAPNPLGTPIHIAPLTTTTVVGGGTNGTFFSPATPNSLIVPQTFVAPNFNANTNPTTQPNPTPLF